VAVTAGEPGPGVGGGPAGLPAPDPDAGASARARNAAPRRQNVARLARRLPIPTRSSAA